jgi:transcriptional regulator with XRE-family HTH domain
MPRPTTREKSIESLAIVSLRKFLGESQQQFAARLKTSTPVIGRWETSTPPGKKILKRLRDLAVKVGHQESANVFNETLKMNEVLGEGFSRVHSRMVQIASVTSRAKTETLLRSLWKTVSAAEQTPTMKQISEEVLKLADVNLIAGRNDLFGKAKVPIVIYTTASGELHIEIPGKDNEQQKTSDRANTTLDRGTSRRRASRSTPTTK